MKEAIIAFGTSKIIVSSVSVLQGIEISIGAVTTGSFQPFAFLEPLADVADDFGDLMRVSIVSIITQIFLLKIVSSIYFKIAVTFMGCAYLASVYFKSKSKLPEKLFLFSVFLRFAVVISVGMSIALNDLVLQKPVDEKMKNVAVFSAQIDLDSDTSALSSEEREALQLVLDGRLAELNVLAQEVSSKEKQLDMEQQKLKELEGVLSEKKSQLGYISSIWSQDEEVVAISNSVDLQKEKIKLLQGSLAEQKKNLSVIEKAKSKEEKILSGESSGFWDTITVSVQKITTGIMSVKTKVQDAYNNIGTLAVDMMYVIAAFILRTLIMPILFLYALLKVFKVIWNRDLRDSLKSAYKEIEQEIKN